jgi:hypothetical protein
MSRAESLVSDRGRDGVAVHAEPSPDDPSRAARIVTRVVPAHEVARQTAPTQDEEPKLRDVVHDMKELAESSTPELVATLERLAAAYADWIARQRARIGHSAARLGGFEQDAKSALDSCENALSRMRAGISLLTEDAHAADAFRFANRAMWLQRVHTVYAERRRQGRQRLLTPPMRDEPELGISLAADDHDAVGVPVAPFPRWLRCPACDLLAPVSSGLFRLRTVPARPDLAKYVHTGCNKRNQPAVLPARFLLACEHGHLDDFPWHWFVHRGKRLDCAGNLELRELGVSGEAADVEVRCRQCGDSRRMVEAFGREGMANLPACRARRPQLRDFDTEPCKADPRAILLGASNSWFAVTLSTLFVPTRPKDRLAALVEDHWTLLGDVDDDKILGFLRKQGQLGPFSDFSDEKLWAAIEERRAGATEGESEDIREPEWRVFSNPDPAFNTAELQLREVRAPPEFADFIERVVLGEKLREVTALIGFTRIGSPGDFAEEEHARATVLARLARSEPQFVPASEVRGEGIFIQFREEKLGEWCDRVNTLEQHFLDAHMGWRRRRRIEPVDGGFPHIRYVLIHSFAHALMRELCLECGYSAASLKERIYARELDEGKAPMAGVLIYTAAADAEGTLGGLVRMGNPEELERHIRRALHAMALCSADPLCADHLPDSDGTTLHGGACHACLFAPETSCERGNKYLDRSVLVETMCSTDRAFFAKAGRP